MTGAGARGRRSTRSSHQRQPAGDGGGRQRTREAHGEDPDSAASVYARHDGRCPRLRAQRAACSRWSSASSAGYVGGRSRCAFVDGVDVHVDRRDARSGMATCFRPTSSGSRSTSRARRSFGDDAALRLGQPTPAFTSSSTYLATVSGERDGGRNRDGPRRRHDPLPRRRSTSRKALDRADVRPTLRAEAELRDSTAVIGDATIPADVWVDADGLPAAHRAAAWTSIGARHRRRRRDTTAIIDDDGFYDFGYRVHVEAPPRRDDGSRRLLRDALDVPTAPASSPTGLTGSRHGRLASASMDPVTPSIGWGVLHLYYRVDRERAEREPERRQADRRRRSRRSRPTGTRSCAWRCSATRPTSVSWRSAPTSPGSRRSSRSCSRAPLDAGVLVRLAHRAVGVHARPKTTSGRGSRPRKALDRRRDRGAARRRGASASRTTASSASIRSCRAKALLLLPDVEAPRRRTRTGTSCRSSSARS